MGFKEFSRSRAGLITIIIVLVVLFGGIWASIHFSGSNRIITGMQIVVKPDTGVYFLQQQDVSNLVNKMAGNPIGKPVSVIPMAKLEEVLRKLPYVQTAQVFSGLDGKLKITIVQRIPILRVVNAAGETFFLDTAGIKIPHRGYASPDVVVASGNIQERLADSGKIKSPVLKDLLRVAIAIHFDSFWNAQFEQCYVDNFNDIILVPRVGRHSIVIGNSENLEEKLENLRVFYQKGLRNLGWDKYKIIDLRYRGQVIGVKDAKETEQLKPRNVQKPQH